MFPLIVLSFTTTTSTSKLHISYFIHCCHGKRFLSAFKHLEFNLGKSFTIPKARRNMWIYNKYNTVLLLYAHQIWRIRAALYLLLKSYHGHRWWSSRNVLSFTSDVTFLNSHVWRATQYGFPSLIVSTIMRIYQT